jgi:hypothetical protein
MIHDSQPHHRFRTSFSTVWQELDTLLENGLSTIPKGKRKGVPHNRMLALPRFGGQEMRLFPTPKLQALANVRALTAFSLPQQ